MGANLKIVGGRTASVRGADFYPTPPSAVIALMRVEELRDPVWEPACGDGAISKVLEEAGHWVVSSDLNHHGYGETGIDFLMEPRLRAPHIVTNPPFKNGLQFAEYSIHLGAVKTCLLMRLQWLEGQERKPFFEKHLARVWVFSKRLPLMHRHGYEGKKSSSTICFAWFVFEQNPADGTKLGWLL